MTDYLSRACRLQLTTAMENLVRTAVVEISQIFDNSFHDHQMELARKGEEIAHLKVKLQRAEMKLSDISMHSETDMNTTRTSQRQSKEPPPEESTVPEMDIGVPDDWCVPLGSEIVVKQDNPCPSIRLKQFSIPLRPISLKHKAFLKIEEPSLGPCHTRDKIDLREQKTQTLKLVLRKMHPPENCRLKDVLLNIKQEPSDTEVEACVLRKRPSGEVQNTPTLRPKMHRMQDNALGYYHCKLCTKIFHTALGLSVHSRAHKKCNGCRKIFPLPSVLDQHKAGCKYYKKLMELSIPSPGEQTNSSSIQQAKESTTPGRGVSEMYTCGKCMTMVVSRSLLLKHSCESECEICSKRFSSQVNLNVHKAKVHKKSTENELDLSWTQPLDESEDNQEMGLSESENTVKKCLGGFKCLLCQRVCTTKHRALKHYYSHNKETYKCGSCSKSFTNKSALSKHRISSHGMRLKRYLTCVCSKRFVHKYRYKKHELNCPAATAQKTYEKS
ncbi:uncharacterized protein [Eucyclogobius newberryi]|uniref:uncharacterized protein n=1 Tax=Eucyclogobius newberryi TaxID=166745 RepID=UPI003B59BBF6